MFGSGSIRIRELAGLSRRLATSLEAGLDLRKVLAREAGNASRRALAERLEFLRLEANRGRTLSDSLEQTGDFFPPLFREMVQVGEETGKLAEVFRNLAEHYELQIELRRTFLASITWPMLQLGAAIMIVGLVIWILGIIGGVTGQTVDILGFGLVGNRGAAIYFGTVAIVGLTIAFVVRSILAGKLWARPVLAIAQRLPVIGSSLRTLALSRLAWSLQLTLDAGMPLRRAIPLALRSSRDPQFVAASEAIVYDIGRGREVNEAMADTGVFPPHFIDAVDVGERSGRLPEQLAILSRQYQEQARQALATLTTFAGFGVWLLVAALIIMMIFRIFGFYLSTINEALKGV